MISHTTQLSLSSDGRIPAEAWSRAAALDRAAMLQAPRFVVPRIGRVRLKPGAIVRIMACVIARAAPARAQVHLRDFEQAGISKVEAERHFNEALTLARTLDAHVDSAVEAA